MYINIVPQICHLIGGNELMMIVVYLPTMFFHIYVLGVFNGFQFLKLALLEVGMDLEDLNTDITNFWILHGIDKLQREIKLTCYKFFVSCSTLSES